ncbi:hypothetical protein VNO77_39165 [Canavalia gladiata]|uniref:Uncharacterized protein n=1 Tax=Canavalia gladiata TaxID=3824 RepID=A0AAN9KC32_CANGL
MHLNGSLVGQKLHHFGSKLGFHIRITKGRTKPLIQSSRSPIPFLYHTFCQRCIDSSPYSFLRWGKFGMELYGYAQSSYNPYILSAMPILAMFQSCYYHFFDDLSPVSTLNGEALML